MAVILPLFILLSITISMAEQCDPRNTTLAGFEADLAMVQHQLRGIVRIVDGCSFSVRAFDMLPASPAARWWAAAGTDLHNLTIGSPVCDYPLNHTFSNETLTLSLKNISWDQISVLAVWDPATFSDLGHVLIPSVPPDLSLPPSSSPSPSPSPLPSADGSKNRAYRHPTMFDNCRVISPKYRLRWTLYQDSNSIEIGLEAAVASQFYMAFGWASPESWSPSMINSDIAIAGFTEEGNPFAEDYFITQYSECLISKDGRVEGVCPDSIYEGSDPVGLVNNTELVYGHRQDGVSFIRYRRPLESPDKKYDVAVNLTQNMTMIWALGLIRPPDSLRPYYLPQNHGGPRYESFGYFALNVSEKMDDCLGPLDAEEKEDQDLISADGKIKTPLVVTSGPALHYPNPLTLLKFFISTKKEAPVLRVERGVPVKFSIQAGHDVALYITSDPIGGNATTRNMLEVIYAGGPEAEGVPATPAELLWVPDRNTPDQVYYQSLFEPKMGWRVEVVDGGLTDMYNNSVFLDDQQVTLFWRLGKDSISVAARGEKKSGYLAIGFGSGMVNSFVYVGWVDKSGKGRVNTYWIDGKDAMSIHQTSENLTYVRCKSENGIITFEFTRPLSPSCAGRKECNNIIDPTTPLKVIWAMGAQWSEDDLSERNMHSVTSTRPVQVLLMRGSAEAEQDLRPVLAVHGFMMFVAWGILLPGGILAARYLKHVKGDGWFQLHVYMQYSGIAIIFLGILFAAAELRGFFLSSLHVKFGVTATVLAFAQPVNAYIRPKRPASGEIPTTKRVIWEYFHFITGRCAVVAGIAALFTGMKHLGSRYGSKNVDGLTWALMLWVLIGALLAMYLEYRKVRRSRVGNSFRGSWVLGNDEEDDSVDLLHPGRTRVESDPNITGRMEVQLEPLNR